MSPKQIHLAVDAMGGDFGPGVTVHAVLEYLRDTPNLVVSLFGDQSVLKGFLEDERKRIPDRLNMVHCADTVAMDEKPARAARNKRQSSLWQSLLAVAENRADACVSAGNTGALLAMACLTVGTLDGIDRPAICTSVPNLKTHSYLLDMGANLECSAHQLYQFGLMAAQMARALDDNPNPAVALLNVGSEEGKGLPTIRDAAKLLRENPNIRYMGFVEGNGIYRGDADVIVCDGFAGNVALKVGEGMAMMIDRMLESYIEAYAESDVLGAPALSKLQELRGRIDPNRYNGASLLGLNGVVVKSHGNAGREAFIRAMEVAVKEARMQVPRLILGQFGGRDRETAPVG